MASLVISDILSLLRRLDAAASSSDSVELHSLLLALDAQPVTLEVLTSTKCGVAVARLRAHAEEVIRSSAGSLIKKWKQLAAEGGVQSRKQGSSAAAAGSMASPAAGSSAAGQEALAAGEGAGGGGSGGSGAGDSGTAASSSGGGGGGGVGRADAGSPVAASPVSSAAVEAPVAAGRSSSSSSSGAGGAGGGYDGEEDAPPYTPNGSATAALSAPRERSRKILMEAVVKVVREARCSGGAAFGAEATSALLRAADLGAGIEAELFAAEGYPLSAPLPGAHYAEKFRLLAMRLPRNPALVLRLLDGELAVRALVSMSAEEITSEADKAQELATRKEYEASMQLDYASKNKKAFLESGGLTVEEGVLQCGRCKSRNTEYTQKQTRSADEPMTTFGHCLDCDKRWRFG